MTKRVTRAIETGFRCSERNGVFVARPVRARKKPTVYPCPIADCGHITDDHDEARKHFEAHGRDVK